MKILILIILLKFSAFSQSQSHIKKVVDVGEKNRQEYLAERRGIDFWILTKKDSSNIKKIQSLVVFKGVVKTTFDELIRLWYKSFVLNGKSSDDSFLLTLMEVEKKLDELQK